MAGGKSKNKATSATDTPAQYQEVQYEEEGDETDVEDQECRLQNVFHVFDRHVRIGSV